MNAFCRYVVRIGEYQTNTQIDCGDEFCGLPIQDVPISHVVVHPGYKKLTYENNIALIILRHSMNYTGRENSHFRQQAIFLSIQN